MSGNLGAIVLAAGQGTRMRSSLPKVLHPVCGKPMVSHVLDAARTIEPARLMVVIGHGGDQVRQAVAAPDIQFVEQRELLGTADAVRRCREAMAGCDSVMVLNGDSPLVTPALLRQLAQASSRSPVVMATCSVPEPGRLGRVVRDRQGAVAAVVEAAEYDGPGGAGEINAGQYVFEAEWLWSNIDTVPRSTAGEYYLTHLPAMAYGCGRPAATVDANPDDVLGVDDRVKLATAEKLMRGRILERHMLAGVTIPDPATTYVDADVRISADVTILPNCYLYGRTEVARGSVVGPGSTLKDALIGEGSKIQSSVIEDSTVGARCQVGPFSHVRGGALIGDECQLGNYAEVKNSVLGRGVKMHHFSYLGDADVGEEANIAAGIITCNFDGVSKHRTTIGAHAFVGCDTMLVAPVTVGEGAVTGAGAVVTEDVPPGETVVGVPARPIRRRKSAD